MGTTEYVQTSEICQKTEVCADLRVPLNPAPKVWGARPTHLIPSRVKGPPPPPPPEIPFGLILAPGKDSSDEKRASSASKSSSSILKAFLCPPAGLAAPLGVALSGFCFCLVLGVEEEEGTMGGAS